MCCRLTVEPLDPTTARAVLAVGMFTPADKLQNHWTRRIEHEGTSVDAALEGDRLSLSITPAISIDSQHAGKRHAAGVYFEIAAKYAEKVSGRVIQHSNIGECRLEGGSEKLGRRQTVGGRGGRNSTRLC